MIPASHRRTSTRHAGGPFRATNTGAQLAAGYILDGSSIISRCKKSGMRTLWVSLEGEDELPAGNVNDQLALQAQHAWKDNMDMLRKIGESQEVTLETLSKFKSDPGRFKDIVATERLKNIVDQILKSILGQEPLVVNSPPCAPAMDICTSMPWT